MLTLLQIKATTKVDQVNLVLSDGQILPFPIDHLNQFGLHKGLEISSDILASLIRQSITFVLTNYALRLVGMSPQTYRTVERKLSNYLRTYSIKHQLSFNREDQQHLCAAALEYLSSHGLINDFEYARYLLNKFSRKSQQEIIFRLKNAGVDPNSLPDDFFEAVDESATVKKLVLKKVHDLSNLTDPNTKNKVMAYLVRKGFPYTMVKTVIDEMMITG